ncbi:tyrosine-type recombinase/integrase [Helicobacter suis]|uniref:tyrosine-type recombinase/integrase n=1 Tax=Helicobacter suis TaxID=104628 RepID=UPI00220D38E4|nr:tyrosine-type recombinase/integrase [Helicobacter suis]BDR29162.1 integrase [Helicobacter suis HS1]
MSTFIRELFIEIKDFIDFKSKSYSKHWVKDTKTYQAMQAQILDAKTIEELNAIKSKLVRLGCKSMHNVAVLIHLFRYFERTKIDIKHLRFLKESHIIDFLYTMSLTYRPSSICVFKVNLGIFFRYLDSKKGFHFNFSLKISLGNHAHLPKFLFKERLFACIEYLKNMQCKSDLEKRDRLIVLIVAYSGLRKGNKERLVTIKRQLIEPYLLEWLQSKTKQNDRSGILFKSIVSQRFINKMLVSLGFTDNFKSAGLHMLRHSFGSYIYGETKDLVLTQHVLGHSSIETTKIYIHTNSDYGKIVADLWSK